MTAGAGYSSVWLGLAGVGVQREAILEQQGWRCRSCGESLSDESPVCSMTVPDGIAIVCAQCSSALNRLLRQSQRF